MSENSNDKTNQSSEWTWPWKDFSLREKIAETREKFNQKLASMVPKEVIPKKGEGVIDVIKKPLYTASDYIEENVPYFATLSRSHAPEMIAAYTIGNGLFSWKFLPRKYLAIGTFSGFAYGALATGVTNFKWIFPKDE